MKRFLLCIGLFLISSGIAFGQVSITDGSTITVDFSTTVSGVNNSSFDGTGFASVPGAGDLDADAWATTGFSDGSKGFGVENTSGDHARGTSSGGTSSGGLYSFDVGSSDPALGFQGTGGDFTPGTITLRINNNSGSIITDLEISYEVWVFNDQGRANSLNFSHDADNSGSYTSESSLDFTSTATADGVPAWSSVTRNITISSLSVADGSSYYIRWESDDVSGSGSRDEIAIDDIEITPTLEATGSPDNFDITEINGGSSPSVGTAFDVVVQLRDSDSNPVNATQDTSVTLSLATGTGSLGGTLTGTISSGNNSVTISGVTYDTDESGVSVTATNTGGSLTAGTSSTFEVLEAANQLVIVGAPSEGTTDVGVDQFTVEARRTDNSVDLNYTESVTVSIASGTGNLGGTTSQAASSGVATFNNISFDAADDFTIQASDGSLTSSASGTITISDPEQTKLILTGVIDGPLSGGTPKAIELFVLEDIADLSDYALGSASNGGGSAGEEYTFPSEAATAGDFIYVASESTQFANFFGFSPDYTDGVANINGDDALELFLNSTVVDVYGDVDTDGSGQSWDHLDGWGYRVNVTDAATTFDSNDWIFSGTNALDGESDNASASTPFPNQTYTNGTLRTITGDAGWRLLSIPKTGATGADISDDGLGAQFTSNTDSATIYTYDNTGSFEAISSDATSLTDGYGLAVYFFDNTDAGSSELPLTLDITGSEPASDVSVSLNAGAANQFTLVGNPFASNYNTNSISATGGSISDNVSFWNDGTSSYSAQDRTTDYIVAPWQGFWVETADASVTGITIGTAGKSTSSTSGTFFSKTVSNRGDIAFTLSSENSYDEAIKLAFRDYATLDFDRADASKLVPMTNSYATMAFKTEDGKLKSVESLPWGLSEEVKLDLELTQVQISGGFTFDWKGLETIPSEWNLTFHDYEAGLEIDMRAESKFVFDSQAPAAKRANPISILKSPAAIEQKSKSAGTRFGITITPNTTSVNNEEEGKVNGFELSQNYPNPFNPTTTINYSVENAGQVTISVYNLMGQKVAELVNESKAAGSYNVTWNAANAASGMYYYRLEAGGQSMTRKMTLIK